MALVGVQRSGAVWVGAGTEAQRAGTPSRERAWRILALPRRLEGGNWYRLRIQADFNRRRFTGCEIEGAGLRRDFDLRGIPLDFPNPAPFDQGALLAIVGAMRGRETMRRAGTPLVQFDDVTLAVTSRAGTRLLFLDGFERQAVVPPQPPPAVPIRLDAYDRGRWYKEREEALFRPAMAAFARSGTRVGVADARLD